MKTIDSYIVEKLIISRNLTTYYLDRYKENDICIMLNYYDVEPATSVFQIVKIKSIDKENKKITYCYLPYKNHNAEGDTETSKILRTKKYIRILRKSKDKKQYDLILPHKESINLVDELINGNGKFNVNTYLEKEGTNMSTVWLYQNTFGKLLEKLNGKFK